MESICSESFSIGVSTKRVGWEEPAQHQTMSGGFELFQMVVSERTRVASEGNMRSADMYEKRRVSGWRAPALMYEMASWSF